MILFNKDDPMRNVITVEKEFNAPLTDVFNLLSKHSTYNTAFAPLQVVRVKDSADSKRPDGLGSIRRMGFGPIKPLKEEITLLEENKSIEFIPYQINLKGITKDEYEFNNWIKESRNKKWLKRIEIKSIKTDKKNNKMFELIITID